MNYMNAIKSVVFAAALTAFSASASSASALDKEIAVSNVSVAYNQPFYILKGVVKNTTDKPLNNVKININVYEHGRVVDTITAVVKAVEPGQSANWQTPTTKTFNKYLIDQIVAD